MRCTNVLQWELNRYRQQMTDDRRRHTTTHFKSLLLYEYLPIIYVCGGFLFLRGEAVT